jgi:hypothetical protein
VEDYEKELEMSTNAMAVSQTRFKVGWIILLLVAAICSLGHFVSIFFLGEPTTFTFMTVSNLYAFLILLIPFRRGEKWAWWATWMLPIVLMVPAVLVPSITVYYLPIVAVCVLGLLLTMKDFFSRQ